MKKTDTAYKMSKRGCSIDTIASLLSVSEKTAKSYVRIGRSDEVKENKFIDLSLLIESIDIRIRERRSSIMKLIQHKRETNEMGRWGRFIMVLKGER